MKKEVSIIIAVHNEELTLSACLDSVFSIDYDLSRVEVIVVDNNSQDRTAEVAMRYPVRLLSEKRQGAAWARNAGIAAADSDFVVFLDADAYVDRAWLRSLLQPFSDSKIGAVGGKILPAKPGIIADFFSRSIFGRYPCFGSPRIERSCASCNLAIRREWLREFRFDPSFRIAEDLDLTMRLTNAGYRIIYQPTAIVRHEHPRTFAEFIYYWRKWAAGRSLICDKYPHSRTCFLMRFQIFTLYYAIILVSSLWSVKLSLILTAAPVAFVYKYALKDYFCDRRIFASLVVAPVLNFISLPIASIAFAYEVCVKKGYFNRRQQRPQGSS